MAHFVITGGAGFLGHHLVEHIRANVPHAQITVIDALTYAAMGGARLQDSHLVRLIVHDLAEDMGSILRKERVDFVIHLAAETHVDRSIVDPVLCVKSNVLGTCNLLQWCREHPEIQRILYFSTDEVFGPANHLHMAGDRLGVVPHVLAYENTYGEWDRYNSCNPYSATKAGGEEIALAFRNTYGLPIIITHCMNLFGERQHVEKFVPHVIKSVLAGDSVKIHADADRLHPGSRSYLHARNASDAVLFLLQNADHHIKYNIPGQAEVDNLHMAQLIAKLMGKDLRFELVDFHSSRPGHDLRYALDGELIASMGWKAPLPFAKSLQKTIRWTLEHPEWLQHH